MADFTGGQLPEPTRLYPPSGSTSTSGAAIAGTVLGGITSAASTYFEKEGKVAQAEGGNALSKQISDVVQDRAQDATPPLVGQGSGNPSQDAGAASPTGQKLSSDLGRLSQASQQGAMSEMEKLTRINTMVQDAVNKDPLHADYYRGLAKDVLGVTPTAKIFELQNEANDFTKALQQDVYKTNVMAATNAGITLLKTDGSGQPDLQAMAASGAKVLQSEKDAAKALSAAQLASAQAGSRISHEDMISQEVNTAMLGLNPTLEQVHDGLLNNLPVRVSQLGNQGRDATVAQLGVDLNNNQAQTMNYVDSFILKNHISPEAASKIRGEVHSMFDDYRTLFGDPKASLDQISANAKILANLKTKGQLDFRKAMPVAAKIYDITGPQGISALFSQGSVMTPDTSTTLQNETQSFLTAKPNAIDTASAAHSAMTGDYNVSAEQRPQWQSDVTSGIVRTVNEMSKTPEKLNGKQQAALGHSIVQIANVALNDKSPKNLEGAASVLNNPSVVRSFVAFAKNPDNAAHLPIVALGMNSLFYQHIASARRTMAQGADISVPASTSVVSQAQMSPAQERAGYFGPQKSVSVHASSVYNPQTGQVEFVTTAKDDTGKTVQLTPQQQQALKSFAEYRNSVLQVNRSLDAMTAVSPYAPDGTASLKPLELRGVTALTAGIPIKPGMSVPMPQAQKQQQDAHKQQTEQNRGSFAEKINDPHLEGGGAGADNPRSSAHGFGQFIKSTFLAEARKHFPNETEGKTDAEVLALRDNEKFANGVTEAYRQDNARSLKAAGFDNPTDTDLYLAHHFGAADAIKIMKAPIHTALETILSPRVMRANPDLKGKTPLQLYRKYGSVLGED